MSNENEKNVEKAIMEMDKTEKKVVSLLRNSNRNRNRNRKNSFKIDTQGILDAIDAVVEKREISKV